jgi:hypothetical protein
MKWRKRWERTHSSRKGVLMDGVHVTKCINAGTFR